MECAMLRKAIALSVALSLTGLSTAAWAIYPEQTDSLTVKAQASNPIRVIRVINGVRRRVLSVDLTLVIANSGRDPVSVVTFGASEYGYYINRLDGTEVLHGALEYVLREPIISGSPTDTVGPHSEVVVARASGVILPIGEPYIAYLRADSDAGPVYSVGSGSVVIKE